MWQDPHRDRSYADADSWGFAVPRTGVRSAHVHVTKGDVTREHNLDVARARISGAHAVVSDLLFEVHFLYPIPGGMYVAGLLAMLMFVPKTALSPSSR